MLSFNHRLFFSCTPLLFSLAQSHHEVFYEKDQESAVCLLNQGLPPPHSQVSRSFENLGAFALVGLPPESSQFETDISQIEENANVWSCSKSFPVHSLFDEAHEDDLFRRRLQGSTLLGGFLSPFSQNSPNFQVTEFIGRAKQLNVAVNRAAEQAQTLMGRYNNLKSANQGTGMLSVLENLGGLLIGTTTPAPQATVLDTFAGVLASALPPDQAKRVSLVGSLFNAGLSQAQNLASVAQQRTVQSAVSGFSRNPTPLTSTAKVGPNDVINKPVVLRASLLGTGASNVVTRRLSDAEYPKRILFLGCPGYEPNKILSNNAVVTCLKNNNDGMLTLTDVVSEIDAAFGVKGYDVVALLAWVGSNENWESKPVQRNAARILRMSLNRLADAGQNVVVVHKKYEAESLAPCQIGVSFLCIEADDNTLIVPSLVAKSAAEEFAQASKTYDERLVNSRRQLLSLSASSFGHFDPFTSSDFVGLSSSSVLQPAEPQTIKSSTQFLGGMGTSTTKSQGTLDAECFFTDTTFEGTLISNTPATNYKQCQQACSATPSCSYFSFSLNGDCSQYLDASGTSAVEGTISGPYSCEIPGAETIYDEKELELFQGTGARGKLTTLLENPPVQGNVGLLVGNRAGNMADTATKVAEGASGFLDTASTLMSTGQQFLQTFPLGNIAKVGGSVAKDRLLKSNGKKGVEGKSGKSFASPPAASAGNPRVVCHVEGMTCCVPRVAVTDWQKHPPTLNGDASPGCVAAYVSTTDEMCVTTTYDGTENCDMTVTETDNSVIFDSTMVLPSRAMNDAQCQCTSTNKDDPQPSFEPVATWIYTQGDVPSSSPSGITGGGLMATAQKLQAGVTAFSNLLTSQSSLKGAKTVQGTAGITGPQPIVIGGSEGVVVPETRPAAPEVNDVSVMLFPDPVNGSGTGSVGVASAPRSSIPSRSTWAASNPSTVQFTSEMPSLSQRASSSPTDRPATALLGAATQLLQVASTLSRGVTNRGRFLREEESCWVPWPVSCQATPVWCRGDDCVAATMIDKGCPDRRLNFEVTNVEPGKIQFNMAPVAFGLGEPAELLCDFKVIACGAASVEHQCEPHPDSPPEEPLHDEGLEGSRYLHVTFRGGSDLLLDEGGVLLALGPRAISMARDFPPEQVGRVDLKELAFQSRLRMLVTGNYDHVVDLYRFPTNV